MLVHRKNRHLLHKKTYINQNKINNKKIKFLSIFTNFITLLRPYIIKGEIFFLMALA